MLVPSLEAALGETTASRTIADLDASEIAFLLGFEELNSFSRAFHGWEESTPTRWRDEHASRLARV
jgi:AraC-like DNA-binding protein